MKICDAFNVYCLVQLFHTESTGMHFLEVSRLRNGLREGGSRNRLLQTHFWQGRRTRGKNKEKKSTGCCRYRYHDMLPDLRTACIVEMFNGVAFPPLETLPAQFRNVRNATSTSSVSCINSGLAAMGLGLLCIAL